MESFRLNKEGRLRKWHIYFNSIVLFNFKMAFILLAFCSKSKKSPKNHFFLMNFWFLKNPWILIFFFQCKSKKTLFLKKTLKTKLILKRN